MEADAHASIGVTEEALSELSRLATNQVDLEEAIEAAEDLLKSLKEKHFKVSETEIPTKMFECGMSEFKLTNGRKITVKKYYSASIGEENKVTCFDWIRDNGHEDIIKHTITIPLGRDSEALVSKIAAFLKLDNISYTNEEKVHPQTLKAFVKEQVEAGSDLPLDSFKVYIGNKSIIK